jgi:4-hydroxy-L-threonine phosphate dehydrogenase PdxA
MRCRKKTLRESAVANVTWDGWETPEFARGVADAANGAFMLSALRVALDLAQRGEVDAICFAPLNKAALRAGGMAQEDELRWFADVLEYRGPVGEFNVLENPLDIAGDLARAAQKRRRDCSVPMAWPKPLHCSRMRCAAPETRHRASACAG